MGLEILVCIKQVPHPDHFSEIHVNAGKGRVIADGIPVIMNPLDRHAVEEALRNRERFSGRITVIRMGRPRLQKAVGEALAMGADRAVLLYDTAFASPDTLATAFTLFYAIRKLGRFDLIYCGNETVDSGTAQVGPMLAELLDIPQVSSVQEISFIDEKVLEVKRALERGRMKVRLKLPALLSVTRDINTPRLPTVQGIMEVAQKEVVIWNAKDIKVPLANVGLKGSSIHVAGVHEYKTGRRHEIVQGSPQEKARRAVARLKELGAI
jgi:electron transfer flavoprotein beta subunit